MIDGGEGNDTIDGGDDAEADIELTGGEGNDRFIFRASDTVTDFTIGEDRVDVHGSPSGPWRRFVDTDGDGDFELVAFPTSGDDRISASQSAVFFRAGEDVYRFNHSATAPTVERVTLDATDGSVTVTATMTLTLAPGTTLNFTEADANSPGDLFS